MHIRILGDNDELDVEQLIRKEAELIQTFSVDDMASFLVLS